MEGNLHQQCDTLEAAWELVVTRIDADLSQLDGDMTTLNKRINRHRVEINENRSQGKATNRQVSELSRRLEVLEEKDALREGILQSLQEEVTRLREDKGKGVDRGESPYQLKEGMLTDNLEDLFASLPRSESKLSYFTPPSMEAVDQDSVVLAEWAPYQPMVGEGEPSWDSGPENEGRIYDLPDCLYQQPPSPDPNDVPGEDCTPEGWRLASPRTDMSVQVEENEDPIPVPAPPSPTLSVGTVERASRLRERLTGRRSAARAGPYVVVPAGPRRGRAYRKSGNRFHNSAGGWGVESPEESGSGSSGSGSLE